MLAIAVLLTGCLHQRAVKPDMRTDGQKQVIDRYLSNLDFSLVKKHIQRHQVSPEVWRPVVMRKYWIFMRKGWNLKAASVAHAFDLGSDDVGRAFEFARNKAVAAPFRDLPIPVDMKKFSVWDDYSGKFNAHYLREEIMIACRYGPTKGTMLMAFAHAHHAFYLTGKIEFLWLTMEEKCKLPAPWDKFAFHEIIANGYYLTKLDKLKKIPLTEKQIQRIVSNLFSHDCTLGFGYALDMKLPEAKLRKIMKEVTCWGRINGMTWRFQDKSMASRLFFFSMREKKYDFAYALIRHTGFGDDGFYSVAREVLRSRSEYEVLQILPYVHQSDQASQILYILALEQGKVRFVGHAEKEGEWLYRAYNRAIELHKFEWAAEIAHYGNDGTLKKRGPRDAMIEAMHANEFFSGRVIRDRFKVSYELYWKTYRDVVGSRPKRIRGRKWKPACPEDWTVKRTACK